MIEPRDSESVLPPHPFAQPGRLAIGISACLLGESVRYDGHHSYEAFLAETVASHTDLVPICPEVALGLGVPRAPIRLVGTPDAPRALGTGDPELDLTGALSHLGRKMAGEMGHIRGVIFKSKSPSCGLRDVKVFPPGGAPPRRAGRGLYAGAFTTALPLLPAEDELGLGDPELRDRFFERVFAYHRWRVLIAGETSAVRLNAFHHRHRLALMAHGADAARRLDRLVDSIRMAPDRPDDPSALCADYGAAFMARMSRKATRNRNHHVLMKLVGYLREKLPAADHAELLDAITAYRAGWLPLPAPITLLRHHFGQHPHPAADGQTYLEPSPAEMALRWGV